MPKQIVLYTNKLEYISKIGAMCVCVCAPWVLSALCNTGEGVCDCGNDAHAQAPANHSGGTLHSNVHYKIVQPQPASEPGNENPLAH